MRLQRLCWEPRGQFYLAVTDAGWFKVPNVSGGWHARTPWTYSALCKPLPTDLGTALRFLAVPVTAPPRMGGCNCVGRRQP